ncbi:MAG: hypothetical protein ACOZNI_08650 [Myxococcota bacterium]
MTPAEALDRLRADPGDASAWAVVDDVFLRAAARESAPYRDEAVRKVRAKLEDQALSGDLVAETAGYLHTMVANAVRDLVRREKRRIAADERAAAAERARVDAEAREPEPLGPALAETLELVVDRAVTMRDPWQRDHLRRAWRQIVALHTTPRTLREIVAGEEGLADEAELARAVARAHKAHQRAREAMLAALDWLEAHRKLDRETAHAARSAVGRLKRRQDRGGPGVSRAKDHGHGG